MTHLIDKISETRKDQIIAALKAKKVIYPCPRCGSRFFDVLGERVVAIIKDPDDRGAFGDDVPTIVAACAHCGFISEHAQSPLGIMKEE